VIGRLLPRGVAALAITGAALSAHAVRPWLLPSATLVEGGEPVVSVDAAGSEDLFEFDTVGLDVDELVVTAPDGTTAKAEGRTASRRRVSFDVRLPQKGTYRLAGITDAAMASWKVGGEAKRWRGAPAALAGALPADAQDVAVTRQVQRVETFVSRDGAGPAAPAKVGSGIELQPLDPPTDLSAGDTTRFRLWLDGKPFANADVTVIRGGNRYRYRMGEIALKTDADGAFAVTWPEAGRWWLGASHGGRRPGADEARGTVAAPLRREGYAATFEVLPR